MLTACVDKEDSELANRLRT